MDPNARRPPVPDSWLRPPSGGGRPLRRWVRAVGLGLLVLLTVWGFGRSGFPAHAGWFLAVGLVAGAVTTAVTGRRARPR
ncbi:MAG: hypothetical protein KY457_13040 [Actinobacteria bacterium]|nr:hypothetical protein [Actinomycetota bacterium]